MFLKGVKNFVFCPRSPELRFVVPMDLRQRTARPDDTAGEDGIISRVKRERTIMNNVASVAKQNGERIDYFNVSILIQKLEMVIVPNF